MVTKLDFNVSERILCDRMTLFIDGVRLKAGLQ